MVAFILARTFYSPSISIGQNSAAPRLFPRRHLRLLPLFTLLALSVLAMTCGSDRAILEYNRGVEAYEQGNLEQALAYFDQAIALDPDLADAYVSRSVVYTELGEYDKALADVEFRQIAHLSKNSCFTIYALMAPNLRWSEPFAKIL